MKASSTAGRIGNQKGAIAENRVLNIFSGNGEKPPWLIAIIKASREMDQRGIDAIAITDVGEVFLQVKSSTRGARKFSRRYAGQKGTNIGVIIVQAQDSDSEVREKVLRATRELRCNLGGSFALQSA